MVQDRRLDRRAVAVVSVIGKISFPKLFQQSLTESWLEGGDMKERRMIKPDHFPSSWVGGCYRSNLISSQTIALLPFELDVISPAIVLGRRLIGCLKHCLPRQTKSVTKVAQVHPLFSDEAISNRRVQAFEDLSTIADGRLASILSGRQAKEEEPERK